MYSTERLPHRKVKQKETCQGTAAVIALSDSRVHSGLTGKHVEKQGKNKNRTSWSTHPWSDVFFLLFCLLSLEEENGAVSEVEVNEMFGLCDGGLVAELEVVYATTYRE